MSMVRLMLRTWKNHHDLYGNNNEPVIRRKSLIWSSSLLTTMLTTILNGVSFDLFTSSLYRWLLSGMISSLIEISTVAVIGLAMSDLNVRQEFATRFLRYHQGIFIFSWVLLFVSGVLFAFFI